jgi:hypothetical protein
MTQVNQNGAALSSRFWPFVRCSSIRLDSEIEGICGRLAVFAASLKEGALTKNKLHA